MKIPLRKIHPQKNGSWRQNHFFQLWNDDDDDKTRTMIMTITMAMMMMTMFVRIMESSIMGMETCPGSHRSLSPLLRALTTLLSRMIIVIMMMMILMMMILVPKLIMIWISSENRVKVSVRCPGSILRLETTMDSLTRMIARPPLTYQSRQEFSCPDIPYREYWKHQETNIFKPIKAVKTYWNHYQERRRCANSAF